MSKFSILTLGLLLAVPCPSFASQDAPPPASPVVSTETAAVTVPVGTKIPLVLSESLDSQVANTGQKFALAVSEDVVVDGVVVVPKGAAAQGTVLFARKKGAGRSGALDLRVDYVDTPAGRVRVRASQSRRSEYIAADHAVTAALFGLAALSMQGEAIVLEPGAAVEAEVMAGPVAVEDAP